MLHLEALAEQDASAEWRRPSKNNIPPELRSAWSLAVTPPADRYSRLARRICSHSVGRYKILARNLKSSSSVLVAESLVSLVSISEDSWV